MGKGQSFVTKMEVFQDKRGGGAERKMEANEY
jgi:hypothetical protein